MEEIQSYTDKLRKTYRQSFDVILPFTNHETVVYCNDDEFENYLKGQNSLKDLQACIYLLERHIDLQQEIIQGLTHLQEIHKYDKLSSEYNSIADKLIVAQDKLALLRSRTVRCLTKQIQQRCGDSSAQLSPWTLERDTRTKLNTPLTSGGAHSHEHDSSVTSSNSNHGNCLTNEHKSGFIGENSFDEFNKRVEETWEENGTFEELSQKLGEKNNRTLSGKTDSGIALISNPSEYDGACQIDGAHPDNAISCKEVSEEQLQNMGLDNSLKKPPKVNQPLQCIVADKSSMDRNENPTFRRIDDVPEEQFATSSERDKFHEVDNSPDASRFNPPSHSEEISEKNMNYGRRVLEPVDETVVVELMETSPSDGTGVGRRGNGCEERTSSEEEVVEPDQSSIDIKDTIVENCTDQSDPVNHSTAPDELVSNSNINTLNWDPGMLVREIYGKVKESDTNSKQLDENMDTEEIHMAGYLEKLPMNKKKASLLKNWRKRYFKILHGKLLYFEDHRATTPIGFIKLGGSEVFEIGNKCLQVTEREDLGNKVLVIRCASWPEVKDWRKVLESEATQKVKRQHFELQPETKLVIIVDFGSSSIKAGFLEDNAWPQVIMPSVCAVHKENSESIWYGYEALEPSVRNCSKLIFPLRSNAAVGKYLLDPNQLIGFLEVIFKQLQVDPSLYQVIMTTPVNLRDQDKERLVEIMLDYFQVAGVYMKSQAILSMYSYSATCGIIVNIGDNIDVVPIEDGYIVEPGVALLPYGGRQLTEHFIRLLSSSGHRYFSQIENYIGEYLKIKTCYISQNFEQELKDDSDSVTVDMSQFSLPNGDELVTVGKERFRAYEALFNPELWGKDNAGLTELVYQAVMACSIDNRKDMCRNIFLSGATTNVPGIAERLHNELSVKFPPSVIVQVHAAADRQFAAYIGAAVLASLENFDDLCITGDEWEQVGPEALKKWDGV